MQEHGVLAQEDNKENQPPLISQELLKHKDNVIQNTRVKRNPLAAISNTADSVKIVRPVKAPNKETPKNASFDLGLTNSAPPNIAVDATSFKDNLEIEKRPRKRHKSAWRFKDSEEDGNLIVKQLELTTDYRSHRPSELFKRLEGEGQLSPKILEFYSQNTEIKTLSLRESYAPKLSEAGHLIPANQDYLLSTKVLYTGFTSLIALDLTNVPITDNELRFIIKLQNLKALSLSGTLITERGLKYLSEHSKFQERLECLKLCYVDSIVDSSLKFITKYQNLQELDLLGTLCTIESVESLVKLCSLKKIRMPISVHDELRERHELHISSKLVTCINDVSNMDQRKISALSKKLLRLFKFKSVRAAVDQNELVQLILERRQKEELVWVKCF